VLVRFDHIANRIGKFRPSVTWLGCVIPFVEAVEITVPAGEFGKQLAGCEVRMYNPHEAREDTVFFPAFRGIVSTPRRSRNVETENFTEKCPCA
jgi:hypothetical protein